MDIPYKNLKPFCFIIYHGYYEEKMFRTFMKIHQEKLHRCFDIDD